MDGVVKLQALVRGYIVRKKFKKLRLEYVELVMYLEDNFNHLQVTWKLKEKPCFPSISYECSKGKTKCESVTDSVGKQAQGSATCLKCHNVPVVNICETTTQISNSSIEIENCEFNGDCVSEKTLGVALDTRDMPDNELHVLEKCPTDKPGLATVKDGENIGDDGKSCSDFDSCKDDVPDLQEQIATNNDDDARLREEKNQENEEMKDTDSQQLQMRGLQSSLGGSPSSYPKNRTELIKLKEDLEMELLWIQQAMKSRETYLITKKRVQEK